MGVSLNPKDQVKGGLLADVDATLTTIRFAEYTYPSGQTTIAAVGKLTLEGGDEYEQVWSVGSPDEWEVADDGKQVDNRNGKTGTNDNSNFSMFARELEPAGFPMNKMGMDVSVLDGMKAHWIRKAQPKRAGLNNQDDREKTTLVPEKILKLPWDAAGKSAAKGGAKATGGTTKATPATTAAAPAAASSNNAADLDNDAAAAVALEAAEVIKSAKAGETLPKTQYGIEILGAISKLDSYKALDAASKPAVKRLLQNVEFAAMVGVTIDAAGDAAMPASD